MVAPTLSTEVVQAGPECERGGVRIVQAEQQVVVCNGEAGPVTLVSVSVEAPGEHCLAGGRRIDVGRDDGGDAAQADDARLSASEIDSTEYVCNGTSGEDGAQGLAGEAGAAAAGTLIRLSSEAPGAACAAGGTKVESGFDDSGDGILDPGEVDSVQFTCNGQNGATVLALFQMMPLSAGPECANGGVRLESGFDNGDGGELGGDGSLSGGEIDTVEFVCNGVAGSSGSAGADGSSALVAVTNESAGIHCASGGKRIDTGLDDGAGNGTAGDGILHADEIDETSYVCNGMDGADGVDGVDGVDGQNGSDGADGTDGQDGTNGTNGTNGFNSLVTVSDESAGAHCASGGKRIDAGLDDGAGNGTAADGVLHADEIDATSYVCNGIDGTNGADGTDGIDGQNGSDGADGTDGQDGTNAFQALIVPQTIAAGLTCPSGGVQLDIGLDDGAGAGTPGDGILDEDEIDSTQVLCNGVDGTDGADGNPADRVVYRTSFTSDVAGCTGAPMADRVLTFTKQEASTALLITYYDNFRVYGQQTASADWQILINGAACSSPAPLVHTVFNGGGTNQHNPATITGVCSATTNGPLAAGTITLTVRAVTPGVLQGLPGDCYTGWGVGAGMLEAEEIN